MNNRSFILTDLDAEKSYIKAPVVSGESPLSGSKTAIFSLCPHIAEKVRKHPVVSVIRVLFHSRGFHPHDLITSQRSYLQIPSYQGNRFEYKNYGETQTCS